MVTEERRQLVEHILKTNDETGRLMMRWHAHDWLDLELTMPQLKVVFVLHGGEKTMSELARSLGVSLSTATGIVDRLVAEELVSRRSDQIDRRRVVTCLTEHGEQLMEQLQVEGQRIGTEMLENLTAQQLRTVARATDLVYAAAVALSQRTEHRNLTGG